MNLTNVQWIDVTSSGDFWNGVGNNRDACGENPYRGFSDFALEYLSLPYSNADIVRVFSELNIVKNELRNRLKPEMVIAILDVRYGLKRSGKCCFNYELPNDVTSKIGTLQAYNSSTDTATNVASTSINISNTHAESECDAIAKFLTQEF